MATSNVGIPGASDVAQANSAELNAKAEYIMDQKSKDWTNLPKGHKLLKFAEALPEMLKKADYAEMYGVTLVAPKEGEHPVHTTLLILQKFLRANADDLEKAKSQLTESLKWRKEYQPLKVKDEVFDGNKFGGLGYVTKVKGAKGSPNEEDFVSWNIYGAAAKDVKKTFGDVDGFVRWRVALQEIAISHLKLNEATKIIPDYGKGPDPYKMMNVHDYLSVSFFRRPAEIKNSSSKIIDMFQKYYPETVSSKYFVNVPTIMQWMMGAMKALMSSDSIQSMTWLTYGSELHNYLGSDIPSDYGGKGAPLKEIGLEPNYGGVAQKPETSTAEAPATTTAAAPETAAPASTSAAAPETATPATATTTAPETTTPATVPSAADHAQQQPYVDVTAESEETMPPKAAA